MAVLLSELPESESFATLEVLPHKTWTRAELEVLESTGLVEGRHFELIEGELIDKMGKKRRHVSATNEVAAHLRAVFGDVFVNVEAPIDVAPGDNPRNEPEPDVIVLTRPSRDFENNPTPIDLALAVEVSDSTLRHDMSTKAALYARAGIAEYWVLDVNGRKLHVFRNPSAADARYLAHKEVGESETVSPLAAPGSSLAITDLLP